MTRHGLLLACLTLTTTLAAAADAPSAPPAVATSTPATAVPPAAATPAADADAKRVYAGGLTNPEIEHAFAQFKKRVVGDEVRYCRRESPLGTRLPKTVCYSAEQVLEMARAEREAGNELERKRGHVGQ
jgi:hypothetical protein